MRKFLVSSMILIVAGAGFTTATSAAGIVDQPQPLRLNIATLNGKKKLKVAKKLKVTLNCSKACGIRASFALKLPGGTLKDKTSGPLPANRITPLVFTLNSVAKNYLARNFRSARFTVRVSAKDFATGKRVTKLRTYRFYK